MFAEAIVALHSLTYVYTGQLFSSGFLSLHQNCNQLLLFLIELLLLESVKLLTGKLTEPELIMSCLWKEKNPVNDVTAAARKNFLYIWAC